MARGHGPWLLHFDVVLYINMYHLQPFSLEKLAPAAWPAAMPGSLRVPKGQDATRMSLEQVAAGFEPNKERSQALSQMKRDLMDYVPHEDLDETRASFVVCDRFQVTSLEFLQKNNVGLIVNMCGAHTTRFGYLCDLTIPTPHVISQVPLVSTKGAPLISHVVWVNFMWASNVNLLYPHHM